MSEVLDLFGFNGKEIALLVFGGRHHANYTAVARGLDTLMAQYKIDLVVTGGAPGVDAMAETWAKVNDIESCITKAVWKLGEKSGGPKRNSKIIKYVRIDLAAAFPGNNGTRDMLARVKTAEIPVIYLEVIV